MGSLIDWNALLAAHPHVASVLAAMFVTSEVLSLIPATITRASSCIQLFFALALKIKKLKEASNAKARSKRKK